MNLIRFVGRSLLASYFVVNGAKAVVNPAPLVDSAEPLVEKFVPLAQQAAPEQVKSFVPTDTKTLVRLNGALELLGGLAFATGIGRRPGAAMIAAAMLPHVAATRPGLPGTQAQKEERGKHFLRNLALLGATLVASQDTQGKPDLAWRAGQQRKALAKSADKTRKQIGKSVEDAQKQTAKQAKQVRKQVADVLPN